MPSGRPRSRSRRSFITRLPTAVVVTLSAPDLASAQQGSTPPPSTRVTTDMLAAAQEAMALSLPAGELEQARVLVERNRTNIELLRQVPVPVEVEPAFSFRPELDPKPRTARDGSGRQRANAPSSSRARHPLVSARVTRPASTEALAFAPVTTLAALIRSRQVSSLDLARLYLDRLKTHDPVLRCVVTLTEELAIEQARTADREIAEGAYRGPLHGIPYGIKDLFAAKGAPTTWGAAPYATQVFDYDSTAVARLGDAGAVLVAKLSTGELAVGDLWFRARTRNPWNAERGASGSSAGPASAVAAGLVGFAVGTETGGSIISPASTCGAVGLRPTYGRVSRYGCMTLRWTLDKVGPLTRTVADAALVLGALAGPDGRDETVPDLPFAWDGNRSVSGLRIGVVAREFDAPADGASTEDRQSWSLRRVHYDHAIEGYRKAGATIVPVILPDLPANAVYAILNAEAGAAFDELVRSGAINDLADKGLNGRANQLRASRFIPAVDYIRAQRVRTLLAQQMTALFESVDVFLAPASSDSVTMTNLTGHPAAVVPAGFVDNLPIGLMVTGPLWREDRVLQVAASFEAATDWHERHPRL